MQKFMLLISLAVLLTLPIWMTGCSGITLHSKEAAHAAIDGGAQAAHHAVDAGWQIFDIVEDAYEAIVGYFSSGDDQTPPAPAVEPTSGAGQSHDMGGQALPMGLVHP